MLLFTPGRESSRGTCGLKPAPVFPRRVFTREGEVGGSNSHESDVEGKDSDQIKLFFLHPFAKTRFLLAGCFRYLHRLSLIAVIFTAEFISACT